MKRKGQREQLSSTEGIQKAQLSKRLVTIQTDVDLPPVRQAPHASKRWLSNTFFPHMNDCVSYYRIAWPFSMEGPEMKVVAKAAVQCAEYLGTTSC